MSTRNKSFLIPLFLLLLGAAWLGLNLYTHGMYFVPQTPTSSSVDATHILGVPSRIEIPSIHVDTSVEQIGLTPEGALDSPKGPTTVGWYTKGATPGSAGTSVITGHYGWKDGKSAAFDNLHELHVGDTVLVTDEQGVRHTFVVRSQKLYSANAIAPEVFTSKSGAHLNLITCTGVWNPTAKSYSERVVVFTDLVP